MDRERFISWPCVLIFLLPFCQMGAMQNVPPPGVPLGMESGAIPDSSLTASYDHPSSNYGPERARLNTGTAWFGGSNITHQQWIQVDLSTTYRITGVAIQGRLKIAQWVTSFKVACSIDGITFDNVQTLNEPVADKVFVGNTDFNTVVYNTLPSVKVCRYVRLLPITSFSAVMLRMELYGEGAVPVRLSGSVLRQEGHVEMYTNTTGWGSVCGQGWENQDGRVICRMLGYPGKAEEAGLHITCGIDQVARLLCSNAGRLGEGPCESEGRVEVYQHGSWGPVCDDNFTLADATIVCQILGLQVVELLDWDDPPSVESSIHATLKNPSCSGNERDIRYCTQEPNATCNKYAAVKCTDPLNDCPRSSADSFWSFWSSIYEPMEPPQKISTQTMTASTVSRRPSTTATTRTVRQTSTQNPTTVTLTTTSNPTTVRQTTTSKPTTVRQTTTSNPTTVRQTTTSNPTKVRQTTTSKPTTVRQTTTSNPTTVRETTTSNPTTIRQTTTLNPTTVRQTTTSNPTTVRQTTTSNPTTVRETTTLNPTTVRQTTTSNPTTVRQTTTSNPTTVRQTTTSNPTTFRQTTAANPTTVRGTTTSNPTTVSPTSISASAHTTTLSPIKGAIDEILNETITVDNLDIVSDELANVTEDSNQFDVEDLQSVTDKLSSIVEFASNQNLTEEAIVQVSESVIGAVDNILNIPESTFETASSQQVSKTQNILTTISTLTEAIQKASTKNFTYSGSNIVLAAVKVDRRKFPLTTAIGGATDDVIDFSANEGSPSNAAGVTSVSLPEAILPSVSSTNQVISVSVFLLNSPKLFQGDRPSSSSTPSSGDKQNQQPKTVSVVASPILTVTIEGIDIKDLPDNESIVFVFPVNQTLIREENDAEVSQRCVYWDIDLGEWSDEGCRTEKMALDGMVSCRCSHLTSFAVLLDIKGSIISKALDVISRIGCIASIVCLVITLCVLLGFRKLRRKQPQQILINLSFALLALYVTFVIGIDRPTWRISCTVVAILLHYFCLASLAWMGVEAFNMYMMFVRVLNSYIPKFLLKCSMIGWGIPLIVVIIAVASKWTAYQNYEYCFILPGYSLYLGLILPIGLILSFNGIIFAMVLYKLSCGRISTSKSSTLESKKENIVKARMEAIRRAQNAVAIGTLMGLTWAFGFLSFGGGRYLFNVLFTIFNSLQGVFVFLLFGIRQPELKEKLKMTKKRFLHGASSARRRSSEFWASSSGARMTQRPSDVTFISMVKTDSVAEGQASTHFESTLDTGPALNKLSNDTLL